MPGAAARGKTAFKPLRLSKGVSFQLRYCLQRVARRCPSWWAPTVRAGSMQVVHKLPEAQFVRPAAVGTNGPPSPLITSLFQVVHKLPEARREALDIHRHVLPAAGGASGACVLLLISLR